ncbi:MAG: VWA domain-containing protein [Deltaproteobacteria bacterium]|nr:VWA domain-containing protein [Deltaproteobacteria bacterium]
MRLAFAHAALLGALALIAVPLLIHLISRRLARPLRFAALEFVLLSTRRRARRVQLRQLLLLLLRMALIAALALAVAGPQLVARDAPPAAAAPAQVTFCLDGSASMQARPDGATTLFEQARDRIEARLRELEPTVQVALYLAAAEVRPLVEPATLDRGAVLRALAAARPSLETSDLGQCLARAGGAGPGGEDAGRRVVVAVTDGAAHAWPAVAAAGAAGELELVRVPSAAAPQLDNRALFDLSVQPSGEAAAQSYDVAFAMRRYGGAVAAGESRAEVTLRVDQRPVSRVTALLAPDAAVHKRFMQVPIGQPPGSKVTIAVGSDGDDFALDDQVLAPLELPRAVRALVVDGDPQTVRYRDEVFYLERALEAGAPGGSALQSKVVLAESVTAQEVRDADVVILANVESLAAEIARTLVERVQAGAGLLITAGDKIDPEFYAGALADVLPAPIRGAKSMVPLHDPAAREELALEVTAIDHPLFASLGPSEGHGLARVRSHTVLLVDPGARGERIDLARFGNGAPALIERRVEAGRVLLLCTSIDRDWSDLAIRPGFVPLVQQTVRYLADALDVPRPRQHLVGARVVLSAPRGGRQVVVTKPSAAEVALPVQDEAPVEFTGTDELGLYQVAVDLGAGAARELAGQRFAVAIDPRESDTALIDRELLAGRLPAGVALTASESGPRRERPLWGWALIALALLFALEAVVTWRG